VKGVMPSKQRHPSSRGILKSSAK